MVSDFSLWAQPWWVNLLILVPALSFLGWRRSGLRLSWRRLLCLLAFGIAFGFVEAAVVVYLRAGLTPSGTQAASQLAPETYQQIIASLAQFPRRLLTVELCREAATMVMLISVALLTARNAKERWACFLWAFAAWDLTYYAGLWATLGWPSSLLSLDLLFLIPVPWVSQVWFPVLVSTLSLAAVAWCSGQTKPAEDREELSSARTPAAPEEALPGASD